MQTEALPNMENIIGSEQPNYFYLVGDYILFITYESSTCYICKRTPLGVELLSKGYSGSVPFAFSKEQTKSEKIPYIYFMESTVNDDDTLKNKEIPLYAIEVATGKLKAMNFPVPLEKPYFYDIQVLSGGDMLVTYCDKTYDPQKLIQYLLPGEEVEALFDAI